MAAIQFSSSYMLQYFIQPEKKKKKHTTYCMLLKDQNKIKCFSVYVNQNHCLETCVLDTLLVCLQSRKELHVLLNRNWSPAIAFILAFLTLSPVFDLKEQSF